MKSSKKAVLILLVVLVLIGLGMYHFKKEPVAPSTDTSSATETPTTSTATKSTTVTADSDAKWVALPTETSTYNNPTYGFSFTYPSTWKLTDRSDKTVTISSDQLTGAAAAGSQIPVESISFRPVDKSFFTPHINTKYGEIGYDESLKTLVDVSEKPSRCLAASSLLGGLHQAGNAAIKNITYGSSLMSDPVYTDSAILTKGGTIIIVREEYEPSTDEEKNKIAADQVLKIANSFALLNGNSVVVPACANQ